MASPLSNRKLLKIGLFANIVEFYEFSVYGYLTAVIGQLFFRETSHFLLLIQSFALFSIGFLVRPIGSVFFGYFADRFGRKASLHISLMMMSLPTILIGMLPTYHTLGYWATGCLLILRIVQGFAAGGEFPVSACYVFENSPRRYRSLLCCSVVLGNVIGFLSGAVVNSLLFACFERTVIEAWAWRIPFLLGIPLTLWIAKLRRSLPDLGETTAKNARPTSVIKKLWSTQKKSLFIGMPLAVFPAAIGTQVFSLWMPFYLNYFLKYPETMGYYFSTFGIFIGVCFSFLSAYLTRYFRLQTLMAVGAFVSLLLAYPLFKWLISFQEQPSWLVVLTVLIIFKFSAGLIGGLTVEVLGLLFTEARSTGMSIAFSLPVAVLGGTTPLVCTYMTEQWGLMFPAFYTMGFALMALIAAIYFREDDIRKLDLSN